MYARRSSSRLASAPMLSPLPIPIVGDPPTRSWAPGGHALAVGPFLDVLRSGEPSARRCSLGRSRSPFDRAEEAAGTASCEDAYNLFDQLPERLPGVKRNAAKLYLPEIWMI